MAYQYSVDITENCAKAVGVSLPISTKQSVMICQALRRLPVPKAKKLLEEVIAKKKPIAFTRFNRNTGHKAGMAAGSFPVTACFEILRLLKSAEANAQFKGLSTGNLKVKSAVAQRGPTTYHAAGRQRVRAKRTHVELVLEEIKEKQEAKK